MHVNLPDVANCLLGETLLVYEIATVVNNFVKSSVYVMYLLLVLSSFLRDQAHNNL